MPSLEDLRSKLAEFNQKYPRPSMDKDPPHVSEAFRLPEDWEQDRDYPEEAAGKPGIYLFFAENDRLEYIGKASARNNLGTRLGDYLSGKRVAPKWRPGVLAKGFGPHITSIRFIVLEASRYFEVPAIEEYLIRELQPPLNRQGK